MRLLPPLLLSFLLLSCAAVQYKRGVLIENQSHTPSRHDGIREYPRAYGRLDAIRLVRPPMSISLFKAPRNRVLLVGPGILLPLPLIPWIPGIIQALWETPADDFPDNRVKIILTFFVGRQNADQAPILFNPADTSLIADNQKFQLVDARAQSFVYVWNSDVKGRKETEGCFSQSEAGFSILGDSTSECAETSISLTYDVTYPEIKTAIFDAGSVIVAGQPIRVPPTRLINRGKLKLWWAYTINT